MGKILYADKETIYQNPQIPANQKVQSGDMNSIKNAINQEGRYTPTTYNSANGQFTCQMVGNLEVGDTIQVILDLTSQNENEYYDISISIDDGATYYDLVDTKKGFVLNGSDFEYLEIYLKAVFNGTSFVLISPIRNENIISARINEEITATGSGTVENLTKYNSIGQRIKIIGGVVKIGEGIDKVKVSTTMTIRSETSNAIGWQPYIKIKKANSDSYINLATARDVCYANEYNTLSITNFLISVGEDDLLTVGWYKGTANSITIRSGALSNFEVEEVR